MPDQHKPIDPASVWRSQPVEKLDMDTQQFVTTRIRELHSATRSEILAAIGAAVFFIAVVAWRAGSARDRSVETGLALVAVWLLVSLFAFRRRLRQRTAHPGGVAAACSDYYREELIQRRDHLRSEWLWHGPLFLACLVFIATLGSQAFPGPARIWSVLPLLILLVAWAIYGLWRRRRQAQDLQREIEEIDRDLSRPDAR